VDLPDNAVPFHHGWRLDRGTPTVAREWRDLAPPKVVFPPDIATHSTVQTFYAGSDGLLKRHDYDADVLGGTPAAHYVDDYQEVSGILLPTRRKVLPRKPDGSAAPEPVIVAIALTLLCHLLSGGFRWKSAIRFNRLRSLAI